LTTAFPALLINEDDELIVLGKSGPTNNPPLSLMAWGRVFSFSKEREMSFDTSTETPVTLATVAMDFSGRKVNVATIARYCLKGCRRTASGQAVFLESMLIGGIRMTSQESVQRFIAAQNASDSAPVGAKKSQLTRQAIAAGQQLEKLGV
jgi:hypothetical protein